MFYFRLVFFFFYGVLQRDILQTNRAHLFLELTLVWYEKEGW